MRLIKLEIENFRAVKDLTLEFPTDKKCAFIGGKNGCGKSTIIDSILWLLCDETIVYGCQNDDNLDKNERLKAVNVCGTFIKDDGSELKLRRKLTPKFTKAGEFSKYENEPEINDSPYTIKQYIARIKNQELGIKNENDPDVSSFNTLRCILDYNYLDTIKYQVVREKIEKILKISSINNLVEKAEYSLVKDDLKAALYDISKVKTKFNKQKALCESQVEILNRDYLNMKNAYKPLDMDELERLQKIEKEILEKEYEHSIEYKSAMEKNENLKNKLKEVNTQYENSLNEYNRIIKLQKDILSNIDYYNSKIENLKETFVSVKNSSNKCPKCNYVLNENEIKKKLDSINNEGASINQQIKELKDKLSKIDVDKAKTEFENVKQNHNDIVKEIDDSSNVLKEIIEKENTQSRIFYNEKANKLSEIKSQISLLKSESNVSGVEQKEAELKVARSELAKVEQKLAVLKDYEATKNKIITEKINEVFPNLDFRLFEESDTGAITNTCKVYLKNVGYDGINTGHKVMVGFEVVKSLRKALGVKESLPIIFDDVSNLDGDNFIKLTKENDCQIITTLVNSSDKIDIRFV